jgi:photosystem II stability/assembly factor-like uncharacterized protein
MQNLPGLPELDYRVGDYNSFMRRMLASLHKRMTQNGLSLAALKTRDRDDAAIALLDAWAVVADVLTFYQERIANEGYWRTATERRSLLELARFIGCELKPGVAASTYLAFTVETTPGSPGVSKVPKGTAVISIPRQDELPQTFETSEEIVARADWNALLPRATRAQRIASNSEKVDLQGISTQLQSGDYLLLRGETVETRDFASLQKVVNVTTQPETGNTQVIWNSQQGHNSAVPLRNPQILAFRQRAALFGNVAPKWETLPDGMKRNYSAIKGGVFRYDSRGESPFAPTSKGLPNSDIRALVINPATQYGQGNVGQGIALPLLAGTAGNGIFRSTDNGESWIAINSGLTNLNIESLWVSNSGEILAGTPAGGVFRSKDGGENWVPIGIGSVTVEPTGVNSFDAVNTGLPNTVVRSLLTYTTRTNRGSGTIYTFRRIASGTRLQGSQTEFKTELQVGDSITVAEHTKTVVEIISSTQIEVDSAFDPALPPGAPFFIAETTRNYIFAGTDDGVYRSSDSGQNWKSKGLTNRVVRVLLRLAPHLITGTDGGVFRSSDNGETWEAINQGLTNLNITSLFAYTRMGRGKVTASENQVTGTETQFLEEVNKGDTIVIGDKSYKLIAVTSNTEMTVEPAFTDVIREESYTITNLFAGTVEGLFRSTNNGDIWTVVEDDKVKNLHVTALSVSNSLNLFAASTAGTIFSSINDGKTWREISLDKQIATDITTLAVNPEEMVFAGTKFAGFVNTDWLPLTPTKEDTLTNQIYLDTLYPRILADSWILLINGNNYQACQVISTITTQANGFSLESNVTQLLLKEKVNLALFPPRATMVLGQSESLPLAEEFLTVSARGQEIFQEPIYQDKICLSQFVQGLQPKQTIIVSGKRIRAKINDVGVRHFLLSPDGLSSVEIKPGDILWVMASPEDIDSSTNEILTNQQYGQGNALPLRLRTQDSEIKWQLMDVNGFAGYLTINNPHDITLEAAADDDEIISEVCILQSPPSNQKNPVLTLQEPLKNSYDPATVKIYANVVKATHGETVSDGAEALGSGDGTLANQRFILKKPPLTYVSSDTPNGIANSLQVRVNDVLWTEVPYLYNLEATAQSYIVRIEDDGTTSITFGDGKNGARLPSGEENVVATYRSGIGLAGQVEAHQLKALKIRPLGIQEVTNPLSATGAANPETKEEVRTRAPLTVRVWERIVSVQDFEDFARTFPGIGKAQAVPLWNATTKLVHVTIAAASGDEVPQDSIVYTNLVQAMNNARALSQPPPVISSYQRLLFNLVATIIVNPRYKPDLVKSNVENALKAAFTFEKRAFGQNVTAAEIIAIMQSQPGVISSDLDLLYRLDAPKTLEQTLNANLAHWDATTNQFQPAQLLLLHSAEINWLIGNR